MMIWMDIIKTVRTPSRGRPKRNCGDWARIENRKWRMHYQTKYEEEQIAAGATEEEARAAWMALIGRNYL